MERTCTTDFPVALTKDAIDRARLTVAGPVIPCEGGEA
jgi:hypothetical protein